MVPGKYVNYNTIYFYCKVGYFNMGIYEASIKCPLKEMQLVGLQISLVEGGAGGAHSREAHIRDSISQ